MRTQSSKSGINKQFGSEVVDFRFSRTSVETVLASIRTNVIERVDTVKRNLPNTEQPKPSALVLSAFHPKVIEVAGKLFDDGHFRQAILDTYIALEEYVRAKTGASGFGTNLMQSVFSVNNPIIKVSDDQDEQKGFMWLFMGASMGIRNPKAHKVIPQTDPQRTLEWLAFASVLFRVVDDSLALNFPEQIRDCIGRFYIRERCGICTPHTVKDCGKTEMMPCSVYAASKKDICCSDPTCLGHGIFLNGTF